MADPRSDVIALLRSDFSAEASSGFPRLKRIPCTYFIRFLDYFASLDAAAQDALLDGIARFGSAVLFPESSHADYQDRTRHPAVTRFDAMLKSLDFNGGYRYVDVKSLCMIAKSGELGGLDGWIESRGFAGLALQPREDLLPGLTHLQPAKPAALRKLVDAAFKKQFDAQKQRGAGGDWQYTGSFGNVPLTVWVDFGSQLGQLRYGVTVANTARSIKMVRVSYESLWLHHLGWDYVTEENAARSVDLLAEQVAYVARLAGRIHAEASGTGP